MDGKGRCMDNIFVERLWRSLKYEGVYLHAYASVAEAKAGIGAWLRFYNEDRRHQSLGYRTPRQIYEEGLWVCGRSALPTGSASPASRTNSEGGEMLAFAHIPTGTTANSGFDRDEVSIIKPAARCPRKEPTSKSAGLHLKSRLRLSHNRGPPQSGRPFPNFLCRNDRGLKTFRYNSIHRRPRALAAWYYPQRCFGDPVFG